MTHPLLVVVSIMLSLAAAGCGSRSYREPTDEEKARFTTAKFLFAEGCKRAGETIHRTVSNVDGIMIMKLRPTKYSPYDKAAVDPYGYDFDWDYKDKPPPYISTFLVGRNELGHFVEETHAATSGYRYIEAVDPSDGRRYRFTGTRKVVGRKDETAPNVKSNLSRNPNYDLNLYDFVVEKRLATEVPPRYGVTYDDISTREEREHWIAGSSLKVVDLNTNEVIAERIGYMVDFAQGATPGGRQPWTYAKTTRGWSCPPLMGSYGARRFVEKVLLLPDAQPGSQQDAAR